SSRASATAQEASCSLTACHAPAASLGHPARWAVARRAASAVFVPTQPYNAMTSQMVATTAAPSTDPVGRYPAAKPATAPAVPHASASPNRARHACHHPLVLR